MTGPTSVLPRPPGPLPTPDRTTRYRSWIWGGAVLIGLGVASIVGWIVYGVIQIDRTVDDMVRTREGSAVEFTIDTPQSWTVYVEPQSAALGGLRFSVLAADGTRVELDNYGGDLTYSVTGHSGRALATVALEPGGYELIVEGAGGRNIAIGPSIGGRILRIVVGSIVLGVALIGTGATLLVVGALRQSRARNRALGPPAPSAWSAGEWASTSDGPSREPGRPDG